MIFYDIIHHDNLFICLGSLLEGDYQIHSVHSTWDRIMPQPRQRVLSSVIYDKEKLKNMCYKL